MSVVVRSGEAPLTKIERLQIFGFPEKIRRDFGCALGHFPASPVSARPGLGSGEAGGVARVARANLPIVVVACGPSSRAGSGRRTSGLSLEDLIKTQKQQEVIWVPRSVSLSLS